MKLLKLFSLLSLLSLVSFLIETKAAQGLEKDGVYIVYMGAADSAKNGHVQLLTSALEGGKGSVLQTYRHAFSGFAARLSAKEARALAQKPGVVSVFPDPVFQPHTTRSWDFLKNHTGAGNDSNPTSNSPSDLPSAGGYATIIGFIDSGIWPESESFNDEDMGPIPSHWNGTCMSGCNFSSTNCNKKIIGARYYYGEGCSPRDRFGHGTHVAATAAGVSVKGASYYGLASGTAKGGSPGSRIAVYKACSEGCLGSNILAAFDDAILDGVDVISVSLGPADEIPDFKEDPIAIGAFHAVENGITVVCSAGNGGPQSGTVENVAPWIMTVGATTIDRDFESDVVLGGNKVIKGEGINFANIGTSPVHPLISGKSAKKPGAREIDAINCIPGSMDEDKIKGKIVLCYHEDGVYPASMKMIHAQRLGGIGLVLVDDLSRNVARNYLEFPMTVISSEDAAEVLSYINSNKNPVATVLPTKVVSDYKPAPIIAYFSSRGPSPLARNILKPDVAAPGADILAAWIGNDTDVSLKGKEPPLFNIISGTSMSCPHVSGVAAEVKSQNSKWTPSVIRSAIMTTAFQENNAKGLITTESGTPATAHDYGAGEMSTSGPLQPGLVYETTTIDYLNFLCYYGYNTSTIRIVSKTAPANFTCPEESSTDLISNINYPSISVSNLGKQGRKIRRTATNVADYGDMTYYVTVEAPSEINVKVTPDKLQFAQYGHRLSYQVTFSMTGSSLKEDAFGSITWTNGNFKVRSPFVVNSK